MTTREAVLHERDRITGRSVVALLDAMLVDAHRCRASDVHIDPEHDHTRVRLRIDGLLQEVYTLPQSFHAELIARLKILAHLRTDEHTIPQDGHFIFQTDETRFDVRLSIAATYYAENAVLRLLSHEAEIYTLETLDMNAGMREQIADALAQKRGGMILIAGPTGAGKTTTLYALMRELRSRPLSLITIEDPVEYSMSGVRQMQTNERIGLSFASGLRSILRQDPDVIMVGEIRDAETASLAAQAALTGHLVLSTIHAQGTSEAISRLIEMGVKPYLAATTISLIIAQRLVRKICSDCNAFLKECAACSGTGYAGRIGVFEVLLVSPAVEELILKGATAREIREASGIVSLRADGMQKVETGLTTAEEVASNTV